MSFGGLILTNAGRNKIAGAASGSAALKFTHVKLGDGAYNGSFTSKTELTNEVMEIPITGVKRNDGEVVLECDWNSRDAPRGFYLREVGIIGNDALCYYDNTGAGDAEYIDPESDVVAKQKRLRFTLVISSETNIVTYINSGLYALAEDVNKQMGELEDVLEKKLNTDGGDASDTTVKFEEAGERENIESGEKLSTIFGKIKKFFADLKKVAFTGSYNDLSDTPFNATTSATGLMSAADKVKLDGIAAGANKYTHPSSAAGAKSSGLYKITTDANGHITGATAVIKEDITALGIPGTDTNTTYSNFVKSGSGAKAGLVPAPSTTAGTTKYLREDGTWTVPPDNNTTYSNFVKSGSGAKAGLVPAPSTTAGTTKYLREDGTWTVPPDNNTTYSAATTSAAGLMSAADKTTINGLANTYAKKNIYDDTAVSMGRKSGTAVGTKSFAFGSNTTASSLYSHAEGSNTTASGTSSHAEGGSATASGNYSHAEGSSTTASGDYSHAEGIHTTASGDYSHAEGSYTTASSSTCHAEGAYTTASGADSHAEGNTTTASNACSHASGHRNATMTTGGTITNTTGHAFVIGNGTSSTALKNAFSVMFSGVVKAASTITASTTADYAEFFEWLDKNPYDEDRVGRFVTLDGDKIRFANENDEYILGIVSGEPFVLGNGDCDTWNGMVMRDEFGRTIYEPAPKMVTEEIAEEIEHEVEEIDETTGEVITKIIKETVVTGYTEKEVYDEDGNLVYEGERPVINPNYNPEEAYISRFDRKEWSPIGMLGVLSVYDDGTCEVNGYCKCNNDSIATKSNTGYRVIERITKNIVRVVFR